MAVAVLAFTAPAAVALAATPGWTDEDALQNDLNDRGVTIGGTHILVDFASCQGIRRYGHRALGSFDQYHRFRCLLSSPNGDDFSVGIAITRSVVAASPLPLRDEPARIAQWLRDATETLASKERSVAMPAGTKQSAEQKAGTEKFLRPYREDLAEARAELEAYRTRFWWRVVG